MDNKRNMKLNLFDPVTRALTANNCYIRSYQAEALRTIYDAVIYGKGGRYAVTFPRQSGKNELQAHLEAAVMFANLHKNGSIIKIIPTEKNQGKVSTDRLSSVISGRWPISAGKNPKHLIRDTRNFQDWRRNLRSRREPAPAPDLRS